MKSAVLLFTALLLLTVAVSAVSVEFTITAEGTNQVTAPKSVTETVCTPNPSTNATECVNKTTTTSQTTSEPWSAEQDIEADCELMCNYQIPTFITPSTATIKKYSLRYDKNNDYVITFKGTNTSTTKDSDDKIHIEIKTAEPERILFIEKITPKNLSLGLNQVNILVRNLYDNDFSYVTADVSGSGIKTVKVTPIQGLSVGDKDYVFATVNVTESGLKEAIIKISGDTPTKRINVNYVDRFFVSSVQKEQPAAEGAVNVSALEDEFSRIKALLKTYEADYLDKKSQGYIVTEIYDSIKEARDNLQNVQIALSDNKPKEAQKYLTLAQFQLDDIKSGLDSVRKVKKTFTDKLKENAVLITTISAAVIAIVGLLERAKMKKDRLKEKLMMKKHHLKEQPEKRKKFKKGKPGKLPKINLKKLKSLEQPELPSEDQ